MKKYYWLIIIALFIIRFIASLFSYNADMNNHFSWTSSLKADGFAGFYERDFNPFAQANYPPLTNELFYLGDKISDSLDLSSESRAALFKAPAIAVETIAIVIIGVIFSPILLILLLLNPGIFYNTLLWGQTEGLMAGFVVLSLFFTYRKKVYLAWLMFALALLSKQSAIIFLPLLAIVNIRQFNLKKNIFPLLISTTFFVLMFIPFYPADFIQGSFKFLIEQSSGQQHWSSVNALNFWYLLGENKIPDSKLLFGLSHRTIGILLVALTYIYILFLAIKSKLDFKNSLILAGFVNFAVFLFLTRIHERHLLPTLILLAPISLISYGRFFLYVTISIISFYNIYLIWNERFYDSNFTYLSLLSLITILTYLILLATYRPIKHSK